MDEHALRLAKAINDTVIVETQKRGWIRDDGGVNVDIKTGVRDTASGFAIVVEVSPGINGIARAISEGKKPMRGWKHPMNVDVFLTLERARSVYPHVEKFTRVFAKETYNHPTLGVVRGYVERR